MGYTPLFDTLLTGSLHGRWPHTGVWACLLSRVSREGVIDEHPRMLAAAIGISEPELMRCIEDFCAPDIHSRTEESDGRKLELIDPERPWGWRVVNHSKYKEKARKRSYDQARTESGADAARKRAERGNTEDVPTCPAKSRAIPLSSPTPTPTPVLKKATSVAAKNSDPEWGAREAWKRVRAAILCRDLQKSFPPDSDITRVVGLIGGWQEIGSKHVNLIGQTEQRFIKAWIEFKSSQNPPKATP